MGAWVNFLSIKIYENICDKMLRDCLTPTYDNVFIIIHVKIY